jgi:uncharacterized protein (UPF0218 family)
MPISYRLTPELRRELKKPIGTLIQGSFDETIKKFKDFVKKENLPIIISVGDIVSRNLAEHNMSVKLSIVDNKAMREKIQPIALKAHNTLYVTNPPGTITEEALTAIQKALKHDCCVKLIVDGEEDLLTLAAVLYAPENSFVVYGQPLEGIVVVKVTEQKKAEVTKILKTMKNHSKN